MNEVALDKFQPRDYQLPLIDAIENKGYKKIIAVLPRRAGKDITAFNIMIRAAIRRIGIYYYILPNAVQARRVMFDGITSDGDRIIDYIPKQLVDNINIQQMKVVFKNGSIIQFVGSDRFDCFDDKTEILTDNGWKFFKDLNRSEKVATLVDGYLEYHKPTEYMEYEYDGTMYAVKNSGTDFMVTPNHRFWVKSGKGFYKFKTISDPSIKSYRIPSTCLWKGVNKDTFVFPKVELSPFARGRIEQRSMKMEHFVALLGIFLSEGSTYQSHKRNQITISQTKPHVRLKIKELLDGIGLNYQETKDRFQIECKQMHSYFAQFGKQPERFIPKDIKNLHKKYLQILFDWLIIGDGTRNSIYTAYYSTSKRLIDDVQEIIIKLGLSGNVSVKKQKDCYIQKRLIKSKHTLYEIRVRTSKFKSLHGAAGKPYIHTIPYKGKVYCVSVPSSVIKVRRNGKEMWSGNSLRGTNPVGVVLSEMAYQHPQVYPTLRPILAGNDGWFIGISTPQGHNFYYDLYKVAERDKDNWFRLFLTVDDTNHISRAEIDKEIESGEISMDMAEQEYSCSFSLGAIGAYYAKYLTNMETNNQVGPVDWEPDHPVHTSWDLGMRDSTVILFFQSINRRIQIIDMYQKSDVGLEHYIHYLQSLPYTYGRHIAPHDIEVRDFTAGGMTRKQKAAQLGIKFTVAPKMSIMDGIESVRSTLSRIYIDAVKCAPLVKALRNYRKEYNTATKTYKDKPLHDHHSHVMDAARYLCISLPKIQNTADPEALEKRYQEARYGTQSNMPQFFQNNSRY